MGLGSEVLPEHMMGKRVPLPTMIFELEGMKELMEERLPDDDERCEDAPESMNQVAFGCCRVIMLKALAKAVDQQEEQLKECRRRRNCRRRRGSPAG